MIKIDIPKPENCFYCFALNGEYGDCEILKDYPSDPNNPTNCPIREETHASWNPKGLNGRFICTNCNHLAYDSNDNYCPHCGARMDGAIENG